MLVYIYDKNIAFENIKKLYVYFVLIITTIRLFCTLISRKKTEAKIITITIIIIMLIIMLIIIITTPACGEYMDV